MTTGAGDPRTLDENGVLQAIYDTDNLWFAVQSIVPPGGHIYVWDENGDWSSPYDYLTSTLRVHYVVTSAV